MDEKPLISVLVITYNHALFIRQTLEGIFCQVGDFSLEIVIANDCSTDTTEKEILDAIKKYTGSARIKYVNHQENRGILPNIIYGFGECCGNFIAICEGDDYWMDNHKLQKQLAFFVQYSDCSMVITDRRVIREDGSTYDESYRNSYGKDVFSVADVVDGFVPGTQTFLVPNNRELVHFLDAHTDLQYADRYISYFYTLRGKIYLLPEVTAVYRMTGNGAWSSHAGLRKLQLKSEHLEEFHRRVGIPVNNLTLAKAQLNCWAATIRYCMKRPALLNNPVNRYWIFSTWKKFRHMNRIKILLQIFFKR